MRGKKHLSSLRVSNSRKSRRPQNVVICGEKTTTDGFPECVIRLSLGPELYSNTVFRAQT
jgi:hypothetical protein